MLLAGCPDDGVLCREDLPSRAHVLENAKAHALGLEVRRAGSFRLPANLRNRQVGVQKRQFSQNQKLS